MKTETIDKKKLRKLTEANKRELGEIYRSLPKPPMITEVIARYFDKTGYRVHATTVKKLARTRLWDMPEIDHSTPLQEVIDCLPVTIPPEGINTEETLMKIGHLGLLTIQRWFENPGKSFHITAPGHAKSIQELSIACIELAQNMRGSQLQVEEANSSTSAAIARREAEAKARENLVTYRRLFDNEKIPAIDVIEEVTGQSLA